MGMLFRPLIQRLDDMRHRPVGAVMPLELGAGTGLAAAFGVQPQERDPEQPPLIMEVSLIGRLSEIGTREAARVLVELAALVREAEQLIAAHDAQNRSALENEHAAIRKAGRKALETVDKLREQLMSAEIALRDALDQADRASRALNNLTDAEHENRHLSRWHTDAELAAWNGRVKAARNRVTTANEAAGEARNTHYRAQEELNAAVTELHKLGAAEVRLRNRLEGKTFNDPELGLETRP